MTEERFRTLLADLGKATLRGVRKCPKCGTYNGSRGACCKNKYCDVVFKEPSEKRKLSTEACKLITGSSTQVFSVRIRDKGPDYRGFVQVPITNFKSSNNLITSIPQSSALCFIDNCEKSFNNSVLQCHERETSKIFTSNCQHIQAALHCYAEAQPLTLRNSILSSLNVNNETKQEIWLLATETSGPLVQRVSKNIMAVKCKVSSNYPLGYLHFSFFTTKFKDKIEHKFFCNCPSFKTTNKGNEDKTDFANGRRCIHFYACICAFASEPKLSEEFQYYINLDKINNALQESPNFQLNNLDNLSDDTHFLIFQNDSLTIQNLQNQRLGIDNINFDPSLLSENLDNMKVPNHNLLSDCNVISEIHSLDVIDQDTIFDRSSIKIIRNPDTIDTKFNNNIDNHIFLEENTKAINSTTIKILNHNLIFDTNSIKIIDSNSNCIDKNNSSAFKNSIECCKITNSIKRKREQNKNLSTIINLNSIETRKSKVKAHNIKKYPNTCENIDESNISLSFITWLSSITERINQTMHFQFDGKPKPLIFHVPQPFFECLRERISCGMKKKRLPNSTTAFVRRDGVPLGTFTKYTWHITNILHVKSIFETPLVPLEITRSFVQNADGNYEIFKREETEIDQYKKTSNNPFIKPLELRTYLKVGNTSPNQVQPTPFLIEWIPDILPISKIGELRIRFEFGHVKNACSQC